MSKTIAHVTWTDPQSHIGWYSELDVLDLEPATVTSCGYLVFESKTQIAITTSLCNNGDAADPLVIPKKLILKLRKEKVRE